MSKKISLAILLFLATINLLYGCATSLPINKSNNSEPQLPPVDTLTISSNQEFVLYPGQEAKIKDTNLSIYFLDVINDSRCASDVQCISAGTVNIELIISENGQAIKTSPIYLNIGNNKTIAEDYDLQFLKVSPERGKKSSPEILKSNYQATLKLQNTALPVKPVEVNNPSGVIFPKESLTYSPSFPETQGLWNPTIEDTKTADEIVQKCLINKQKTAEGIVKNYPELQKEKSKNYFLDKLEKIEKIYPKYQRQYIGYLSKAHDHKLVWINFFYENDNFNLGWKKQIITVMDGGYYFFNVLVDLESQQCLKFSINGNA